VTVVRTNSRGLFLQVGFETPAVPQALEARQLDLVQQLTPWHVPVGMTVDGPLWISLIEGDSFLIGGSRGKGKTGAFEPPVDRRETEGQMSLIAAHSLGLDRAHGNAQGGDALVPDLRRSRHNESTHLFMLCSNTPRRESTAARSRVTIAAIGFGP